MLKNINRRLLRERERERERKRERKRERIIFFLKI